MSLTEALSGVVGYRPEAGRQQPAQQHLSEARQLVAAELPPLGYRVRSSGSGQTLPKVPWIAVLDPDVTTTAQQGLYVVYLYDVETRNVFLSMNQGATAHRQHYVQHRPAQTGVDKAALAEITAETVAIRSHLDPGLLNGIAITISLGSDLYLPQGYEAGNIAAFRYDLQYLPPEAQLRHDLRRSLILYQECVSARHTAIAANPDQFNVPAPLPADTERPGDDFRPKDASDYFAHIMGHTQRRSRKHEALLEAFVRHAHKQGWTAVSKGAYPRDLLLNKENQHLLVEAKTVKANSEHAVRECIGQLFTYEFLYYPEGPTNKVALFSAPVGDLWVQLLAQLLIDTIWLEGATWKSVGTTVDWV